MNARRGIAGFINSCLLVIVAYMFACSTTEAQAPRSVDVAMPQLEVHLVGKLTENFETREQLFCMYGSVVPTPKGSTVQIDSISVVSSLADCHGEGAAYTTHITDKELHLTVLNELLNRRPDLIFVLAVYRTDVNTYNGETLRVPVCYGVVRTKKKSNLMPET